MIRQINQYFTHEPEVVLLPRLEWDYSERPNFNAEGNHNNQLENDLIILLIKIIIPNSTKIFLNEIIYVLIIENRIINFHEKQCDITRPGYGNDLQFF